MPCILVDFRICGITSVKKVILIPGMDIQTSLQKIHVSEDLNFKLDRKSLKLCLIDVRRCRITILLHKGRECGTLWLSKRAKEQHWQPQVRINKKKCSFKAPTVTAAVLIASCQNLAVSVTILCLFSSVLASWLPYSTALSRQYCRNLRKTHVVLNLHYDLAEDSNTGMELRWRSALILRKSAVRITAGLPTINLDFHSFRLINLKPPAFFLILHDHDTLQHTMLP
jgi:hypothetical protein